MRALLATALVALSTSLAAAELAVAGDQIIISGRASGNELKLVRDAVAEHGPKITTVILRDFTGRTQ